MTKHRDYTITRDNHWFGFEAVHESYEADYQGERGQGNYLVFHGNTVQECIEQIDEWYGDD